MVLARVIILPDGGFSIMFPIFRFQFFMRVTPKENCNNGCVFASIHIEIVRIVSNCFLDFVVEYFQ